MTKLFYSSALAALIAIFCPTDVTGQCLTTTLETGSHFGETLTADGDGLFAMSIGYASSLVTVFELQDGDWSQHSAFSHPSPFAVGRRSMVFTGDQLAVHANDGIRLYETSDEGTWEVAATIPRPSGAAVFGIAMAADNTGNLFVSAPQTTAIIGSSIERVGVVYQFTQQSENVWVLADTIMPPTPVADLEFGRRIAVDGNWLAVRTDLPSTMLYQRGLNNSWTFQQEIIGVPTTAAGANAALDVSGDTLAVTVLGAVDTYTRRDNTWAFEQRLSSPGEFSAAFGGSIDVEDDYILIGEESVAAYLYTRIAATDLWQHQFTFTAPPDTDDFAIAPLIAGRSVVITDERQNLHPHPDIGEVNFYDAINLDDCDKNGLADLCEIRDCPALDGNGDGVPDRCTDPVASFIGPDGGDWFTASHWSTGRVPGPNADVIITSRVSISRAGAMARVVSIICTGELALAGGDLTADIVLVNDGACVSGFGELNAEVVNDSGVIRPGSRGTASTIRMNGLFTNRRDGRIELDYDPDTGNPDQLIVDGTARLDGVLSLLLPSSVQDLAGEIELIAYGAVHGRFHTLAVPVLPEGVAFDHAYQSDCFVLDFSSAEEPLAACENFETLLGGLACAIDDHFAIAGNVVYGRSTAGDWFVQDVLVSPHGSLIPWVVDISGNVAIIGDRDADDGDGAVHIWEFNQSRFRWEFQARLDAEPTFYRDAFGTAAAVDDKTIVVATSPPQGQLAAVHVFRRGDTDWEEVQVVIPPSQFPGGGWPPSLDISGDRLMIGKVSSDSSQPGQVWLFERQSSEAEFEFKRAFRNVTGDHFVDRLIGVEVDIRKDVLCLRTSREGMAPFSTVLLIHELINDEWILTAQIEQPHSGTVFYVPINCVALSTDAVVHGVRGAFPSDGGPPLSTVFAHRRIGGVWRRSVGKAFTTTENTFFGFLLDYDSRSDTLVTWSNNEAQNDGRYFFLNGLAADDCNDNQVPDICDLRFGDSEDDNWDGIPDECPEPFICPADCAPPGGNGLVTIDDLIAVIQAVSTQDPTCDISPLNPDDGTVGDGHVNIDDIFAVIGALGPCPG